MKMPAPEVTRAERINVNLAKIFGIRMEHNVEDGLGIFLSGRFSKVSQELKDPDREHESKKKYEELEHLVMEHYPEGREEGQKLLDWLATHESETSENSYLMGIRDGIRAAKCFMAI